MALCGANKHYHLHQIGRQHWASQARQVGLGATTAETIIEEVLASAETVVTTAYALLPPGFPTDVAETIFGGILRQCRRLKDQART